jgi:glutathione peroxidase
MKKLLFGLMCLLGSGMAQAACEGIYNHQLTTLQGSEINLCDFQDKPILLVNTASKCGFTPQFEKLENMHRKYREKGLVILGFPSNDFRQEPGSNQEIGDFCHKTYAVDFPMMAKTSVVGPNANPLYKDLAAITKEPPMWNFYKYLILPKGKGIHTFSSDVEPESSAIMRKLKPYLK